MENLKKGHAAKVGENFHEGRWSKQFVVVLNFLYLATLELVSRITFPVCGSMLTNREIRVRFGRTK
jgi:hypothetical protein